MHTKIRCSCCQRCHQKSRYTGNRYGGCTKPEVTLSQHIGQPETKLWRLRTYFWCRRVQLRIQLGLYIWWMAKCNQLTPLPFKGLNSVGTLQGPYIRGYWDVNKGLLYIRAGWAKISLKRGCTKSTNLSILWYLSTEQNDYLDNYHTDFVKAPQLQAYSQGRPSP